MNDSDNIVPSPHVDANSILVPFDHRAALAPLEFTSWQTLKLTRSMGKASRALDGVVEMIDLNYWQSLLDDSGIADSEQGRAYANSFMNLLKQVVHSNEQVANNIPALLPAVDTVKGNLAESFAAADNIGAAFFEFRESFDQINLFDHPLSGRDAIGECDAMHDKLQDALGPFMGCIAQAEPIVRAASPKAGEISR